MLRRWPGGVALAAALGALLLPVGSLAVFFISQSVVALPMFILGLIALVLAFVLGIRHSDESGAAVAAIVVASLASLPQLAALAFVVAIASGATFN